MAVAEMRMSTILPTIKCSSCGSDIQISMMGDHACNTQKSPPQQTLSPPGHPFARPGHASGPQPQKTLPGQSTNRSNRSVPARIDPSAANRPYARQDLLNPSSDPRPPISAMIDNNAPPRPSVARSATSPMPRDRSMFRSHSPDYSSNLDCAFPPFPSPAFSGPNAPGSPRSNISSPKAPSVFSESDAFRRPRNGSVSSSRSGQDSRAPAIAAATPSLEQLKKEEAKRDAFFAAQNNATHETPHIKRKPSKDATVLSDTSPPMPQSAFRSPDPQAAPQNLNVSRVRGPPIRPARSGEVDGFLAQLKEEPPLDKLRPDMRSNTFPRQLMPSDVQRRPSEPVQQLRRPSAQAERQMQPLSSRRPPPPIRSETMPTVPSNFQPPPRSGSRNGSETMNNTRNGPSSNTYHEHVTHAPSDSGSSTVSTASATSSSGAVSTPMTSASSSVSALSTTLEKSNRPQEAGRYLAPETPVEIPRQQQSQGWTPPARPYAPLVKDNAKDSPNFSTPRVARTLSPPESPLDPALNNNRIAQQPQSVPLIQPLRTPGAAKPGQEAQGSYFADQPAPLKRIATEPLPAIASGQQRPGTSAKHVCRGCHEPIVGKSVKAADGRLTGRYHKQCFVCKTCKSAFTTGDFYVFENDPYCEHHYHHLNNSLCAGCGHGIEGQYLETQQMQKFHSNCLTCLTCRTVLNDDYFEIGGKVYCERHAFSAVRSQGGLGPKRDPERRTTRLMMM